MPATERTEKIPLYRYELQLTDGSGRTVPAAMSFTLDGPWMVFDTPTGTVLTVRHENVLSVERGDQVAEQEVEAMP